MMTSKSFEVWKDDVDAVISIVDYTLIVKDGASLEFPRDKIKELRDLLTEVIEL